MKGDALLPEATGAAQALFPVYLLLAGSMGLNAFANFLIKLAVRGRELHLDPARIAATLKSLALNPFFWGGVVLFALALVGYSVVLSRLNLSTAYPVMAGGGFLLVYLLSALYLREALTLAHLGGALLIVLGIWLLLR